MKTFSTLVILLQFSSYMSYCQVNVNDSIALVDLYNSTQGNLWNNHTNWLTSKPVSQWLGIYVENGRVTSVNLSNNNLNGELPGSLGNLDELQSLYIYQNQLHGEIPSTLGNLAKLFELLLNNNLLTGQIPTTLGNLPKLKILYLQYNLLTDEIPIEIGNLADLLELDLSHNNLSKLPSDFLNLKHLNRLILAYNNFTGSIPSYFQKITTLHNLDLSHNSFSGSIPSQLGNLTKLRYLNLSFNNLKGNIPETLGMINLWSLDLSYNRLRGGIPDNLAGGYMVRLYLNHNRLSGRIPESIRYIRFRHTNYSYTNLSDNKFTFDGMEEFADGLFRFGDYHSQAPIPIIVKNNVLSVDAGGTISNNTYAWINTDNKDSVIITGDSTFTPTTNGRYYVRVINSIAIYLTLSSDTVLVTIPSPSKDISELKPKQNNNSRIIVYPNPAKDILHVEGLSANSKLIITDNSGKAIKQIIAGGTVYSYNTAALAGGIYFITIITPSKTETLKFIKQ